MVRRILIIGDIHFGKPFKDYKPNPKLDIFSIQYHWTKSTYEYLIDTLSYIVNNNIKIDDIIFLGDIYDKYLLNNIEYINIFNNILDYIKSNKIFDETFLHILIGNHDTREPQNINDTLLNTYNLISQCRVYDKYVFDNNFLFLPYYKRSILFDILNEINEIIKSKKINNVVVISHNDIYLEDIFIETKMIPVDKIKEHFGKNSIIINGHIHNYYYNEVRNGIVFPGSVSPTSFKDNSIASGICYLEIEKATNNIIKFYSFKNKKIAFISINKESHLELLIEKIKTNINYNIVLRLTKELKRKYIKEILNNYSNIIGYTLFSNEKNKKEDININELKRVTDKIKEITSKNYKKEDLFKLFSEYILIKYKFDIEKIIKE